MSRTRPTLVQQAELEEGFVHMLNQICQTNIINLQEAVYFFKDLSYPIKRQFDWKQLDNTIGFGYERKTYSYKYINDVVFERFCNKWTEETKSKAKQFALKEINRRRELLQTANSDKAAFELCKDIKKLTLDHFGDFKMEVVVGSSKTMNDMLRHYIKDMSALVRREDQRQPHPPVNIQMEQHENTTGQTDVDGDNINKLDWNVSLSPEFCLLDSEVNLGSTQLVELNENKVFGDVCDELSFCCLYVQ
ncbi:Hypothetical_protein [Hexamita inflata]|uniref:Hypothetical_protein n=1 Tax=Hexamita inflata TaxID=28002 RepID=A0AA86QE32_9EUKA|nr:Hypothetical protein HINF_LOCUS44675 [Hexamita inflata]